MWQNVEHWNNYTICGTHYLVLPHFTLTMFRFLDNFALVGDCSFILRHLLLPRRISWAEILIFNACLFHTQMFRKMTLIATFLIKIDVLCEVLSHTTEFGVTFIADWAVIILVAPEPNCRNTYMFEQILCRHYLGTCDKLCISFCCVDFT